MPEQYTHAGMPVPRYEVQAVRPSGSGSPLIWQQAVSVLTSRQAIVMGPTPPGTGVIAPATLEQLSNSQSPTIRVLPSPRSGAGTRLMPTSMTVAPGLIQSPLTSSGTPTATTTISALRQ